MQLTDAQLAAYARQAGFPANQIATAVAVALAESGGRTDATNHNTDGSTDFGLWQINTVHGSLLQTGSWSNPADNARMAYSVWKGSGWGAWTTHNTGAYLAFLPRGNKAAGTSVPVSTATASKVPSPPFIVTKTDGNWNIAYHGQQLALYLEDKDGNVSVNPALKAISVGDMNRICRWGNAAKNADEDKYGGNWSINAADQWLKNQDRSWNNRGLILHFYCMTWAPPDTVGVLPGEGTVENAASFITKLVDFLTNADNWRRVAFFALGSLLVVLGAYHIAGGSVSGTIGKVAKVAVI